MTNLTVLTPPTGEPLSLVQAKEFLRIGHSGEDGLVAELVQSARAQLEQSSGLALVTRTMQWAATAWPPEILGRGFRLPVQPIPNLVAVRIVDELGIASDHTGRFTLDAGRICLRPWSMVPAVPDGGRIEIDFLAGFGPPGAVPEDLLLAVRRMLAHAYSSRGGAGERRGHTGLAPGVAEILAARREVRI